MAELELLEKLKSQMTMSQFIAQQGELTQEQLAAIKRIWQFQNELLEENMAEYTMQAVLLDLQVLDQTGCSLNHFIKSVKANTNAFSLSEFADKMKEKFVQNGSYDWLSVAEAAAPIINRCPGVPLLLGTFKPNAPFVMPERKKKQARQKDAIAERQKAENVQMTETNNESIDVKVNFVIKNLKKCFKENGNHPFPLYNFIIHPTDFTTTVENIFYLSFVIRDGLALIEVVDDDLFISPMEREEHGQRTTNEKKQFIFNITMQKWKDAIEERGITRPAIDWSRNR